MNVYRATVSALFSLVVLLICTFQFTWYTIFLPSLLAQNSTILLYYFELIKKEGKEGMVLK